MKAFAYFLFRNPALSILPEASLVGKCEPLEHEIITSVTCGAISGMFTLPISLNYAMHYNTMHLVRFEYSLSDVVFSLLSICDIGTV